MAITISACQAIWLRHIKNFEFGIWNFELVALWAIKNEELRFFFKKIIV
jgi:hypothetical protein